MAALSEGAQREARLERLEARLGHVFKDRSLLVGALTHGSHRNESGAKDLPDNERLEFLGDAVVDFVAADQLFRSLPRAREGELTALRAALVCEPSLAAFARELGLGGFLQLGKGEAASGGRDRATLLCDSFEALVGALYLDGGWDVAARFVAGFLLEAQARVLSERAHKDAKSRFQELTQRRWQATPSYVTVATSGPDHQRHFVVEVRVEETGWGRGEGRSKALAAQAAAEEALRRFAAQEAEAPA